MPKTRKLKSKTTKLELIEPPKKGIFSFFKSSDTQTIEAKKNYTIQLRLKYSNKESSKPFSTTRLIQYLKSKDCIKTLKLILGEFVEHANGFHDFESNKYEYLVFTKVLLEVKKVNEVRVSIDTDNFIIKVKVSTKPHKISPKTLKTCKKCQQYSSEPLKMFEENLSKHVEYSIGGGGFMNYGNEKYIDNGDFQFVGLKLFA